MLNTSQVQNTFISRILQDKKTRIDFNVLLPQFYIMDGETFERAIVAALTNIIEAKGLRHDPVANAAWPYKKAAGRAWQAVRTSGKAQKLTMRDAFCLAQYLGVPMSQLCALVESQELQGESFRTETAKPEPGRPPKEKARKTVAISREALPEA